MDRPELLTRAKAAEYLTQVLGYPCARKTLDKYATTGGGPPFIHVGRRTLYKADDLRDWLAGKSSDPMKSTSNHLRIDLARRIFGIELSQ